MLTLKQVVFNTYRQLFLRRAFYRWHRALFVLSLKGMGMLNSDQYAFSGEAYVWQRYVQPLAAPTILDVGAHHGSYSQQLRAHVPHARIFAFEPHPVTFQTLAQTAKTHNFTAINAAVSVTPGQFTLHDYAEGSGTEHATLTAGLIETLHHKQTTRYLVNVTTIDAFMAEQHLDVIDFLKIDTEGHELSVLQGAQAALQAQRIRLIQFEFGQMHAINHLFLREFQLALPNFHLHRMLPDGLVSLEPYDPTFHELFSYQNILALPR